MLTDRSDHYRDPAGSNSSKMLFVRVDSVLSSSSLFAPSANVAKLTKEAKDAKEINDSIAKISSDCSKLCSIPLRQTDTNLLKSIQDKKVTYLQMHRDSKYRLLKKNGFAVLGVGLCALAGFAIGNKIDHEETGALSGALVGLFLYSLKVLTEALNPSAAYESLQLCLFFRRKGEIIILNQLKEHEKALNKLILNKKENKKKLEKIRKTDKKTGARLEDVSADAPTSPPQSRSPCFPCCEYG